MADKSHIEWTDATWNPVTGCSVVSPGCTNCYAMLLAGTRLKNHPSRTGLTVEVKKSARDHAPGGQPAPAGAKPRSGDSVKRNVVWNGQVRLNEQWLDQPLRWARPRMIFVCAHGDLFHESVPDDWIDRVFAVMALCPHHIFQVLTKRSERMRAYVSGLTCDGARRFNVADAAGRLMEDGDNAHDFVANLQWPLPNVWLGVSAEDQRRADERIPDLLATPAAVRFVSAEPLLGALNLRRIRIAPDHHTIVDALDGYAITDSIAGSGQERARLDWVIAGGESGKGARPMHPDWARSIRDQCQNSGTAFFFKQWGAWVSVLDREKQDADWRADYSIRFADVEPFKWLNLAGGCGFHGERFQVMQRVGKKAAGRLLDGVEHNAMPEIYRHD